GAHRPAAGPDRLPPRVDPPGARRGPRRRRLPLGRHPQRVAGRPALRRAPVVIFGVLVAATFAAFFVAQRLKAAPSVVQQFNAYSTFSPNGDGRWDASHITFKVKQADDVTVEILDADGDPVRTLMDDKPLAAYTPIKPSLSWDGRD